MSYIVPFPLTFGLLRFKESDPCTPIVMKSPMPSPVIWANSQPWGRRNCFSHELFCQVLVTVVRKVIQEPRLNRGLPKNVTVLF